MSKDISAIMYDFWNKHDFCHVSPLEPDGIKDEYDVEVFLSVDMIINSYSAKSIVKFITDRILAPKKSNKEKSAVKAARNEMERIVYEFKRTKRGSIPA